MYGGDGAVRSRTAGPSSSVAAASDAIIDVYRGWHDFEQRHGGPNVIDFDLCRPGEGRSFRSRGEILAALIDLLPRVDDVWDEAAFLRSRISGSVAYIRALMGQQIPFPEYVERTLGVRPVKFSDEDIAAAESELSKRLAPFGLELNAAYRSRFESRMILREREVIRAGILDYRGWVALLKDTGIPVPDAFDVTVEFVEVDAYWSNWIRGTARGAMTLSINLHPRQRYDRGRPLALCLHEICGHAVHMSIWRDRIRDGTLVEACGATTVHAPEMFVSEGLGQTVADLLNDRAGLPDELVLSRLLHTHKLMVLHNMHLLIYEGIPIEDAIEYARARLPFTDETILESEARDRGTNPLFRTYQLSYAVAEREITRLSRGMSAARRQRFFRTLFTRPLIPQELPGLVGAGPF